MLLRRPPTTPGADRVLTYINVEVKAFPNTKESVMLKFLVDTGAMDCLAPASELKKAGIRPSGIGRYELANGDFLELPWGFAMFNFMDCDSTGRIIFGPDNVEPILGVIVLENAGVIVDPKTQTLRRLATRHLKKAAA